MKHKSRPSHLKSPLMSRRCKAGHEIIYIKIHMGKKNHHLTFQLAHLRLTLGFCACSHTSKELTTYNLKIKTPNRTPVWPKRWKTVVKSNSNVWSFGGWLQRDTPKSSSQRHQLSSRAKPQEGMEPRDGAMTVAAPCQTKKITKDGCFQK